MYKQIRTKYKFLNISKQLQILKHFKQKNIIKKKSLKNSLQGGRFLGEGSYGCVVTPAISCSKKNKSTSTSKNMYVNKSMNKSVSKIIIAPTPDDKEEITISNKLKIIDPHNNYFITFEDACYMKTIPNERKNTVSVKYENDTLKTYDILNNKKYDNDYCPIDLKLKPINLIMPYGGYDLTNIIENKQKTQHYILTRLLLIKNFKACFKNLLNGILKMHNARIVNRDIKSDNIMANYNENKKLIELRFIDFGLSNILTHTYCKNINNIDIHGTEGLISPELIIAFYINDNRSYNDILININKHIKPYNKYYKLQKFDKIIKDLYDKILIEFKNKQIFNNFFGTDTDKFNGYLQKGDIFALGITIFELLSIVIPKSTTNISKSQIYNLLQNMINIDPKKRYNINQCLKHQYFNIV